jgi:hypothetical protein
MLVIRLAFLVELFPHLYVTILYNEQVELCREAGRQFVVVLMDGPIVRQKWSVCLLVRLVMILILHDRIVLIWLPRLQVPEYIINVFDLGLSMK